MASVTSSGSFTQHPKTGETITASQLREHFDAFVSIVDRYVTGYSEQHSATNYDITIGAGTGNDDLAIINGNLVGKSGDGTQTITISNTGSTWHIYLKSDGEIEANDTGVAPTNSIKLYTATTDGSGVTGVTSQFDDTIEFGDPFKAHSLEATSGQKTIKGGKGEMSTTEPEWLFHDTTDGTKTVLVAKSGKLQILNETSGGSRSVLTDDLRDLKITIGDEVVSGTNNNILFVDSSGNLGQNSNLTFDASANQLKLGSSTKVIIGGDSNLYRSAANTLKTDDAFLSASTVTGTQLISTVATGTSPLTVSSTTKVTNLNADLLDGQSQSYYTNASNISSGTLDKARLDSTMAGSGLSFTSGVLAINAGDGLSLSGDNLILNAGDGLGITTDNLHVNVDRGLSIVSDSVGHSTTGAADVNTSGGSVIDSLTIDSYGHVTATTTRDLDSRYVLEAGDTITGVLRVELADPTDFIQMENTLTNDELQFRVTDTNQFQINVYDSSGATTRYGVLQVDPSDGIADFTNGAKLSGGSLDLNGVDLVDGSTVIWDDSASYIPQTRLQNDSVTITAGDKLSGGGTVALGGTITIDHNVTGASDVSALTGGTVIESLTFDSDGHVTATSTRNLDSRYVLDSGDTISGTLNLTADLKIDVADGSTSILFNTSGVNRGRISTHADGLHFQALSSSWSREGLKLHDNGTITYNGGNVWHAGNDGSGSGLDADTLDGQHASAFMEDWNLSAQGGTATGIGDNETVDISGGTDLTASRSGNTITIDHDDTSTLSGTTGGANDGVVIEDITVDGRGHVTAIGTRDLDGRFVNVSESPASGDVSGSFNAGLTLDAGVRVSVLSGSTHLVQFDANDQVGHPNEVHDSSNGRDNFNSGGAWSNQVYRHVWPVSTAGSVMDFRFALSAASVGVGESISISVAKVFEDGSGNVAYTNLLTIAVDENTSAGDILTDSSSGSVSAGDTIVIRSHSLSGTVSVEGSWSFEYES